MGKGSRCSKMVLWTLVIVSFVMSALALYYSTMMAVIVVEEGMEGTTDNNTVSVTGGGSVSVSGGGKVSVSGSGPVSVSGDGNVNVGDNAVAAAEDGSVAPAPATGTGTPAKAVPGNPSLDGFIGSLEGSGSGSGFRFGDQNASTTMEQSMGLSTSSGYLKLSPQQIAMLQSRGGNGACPYALASTIN